jgi:ABC-type Fe3+/spermidine/putrescine transport system ATPase subunit
MLVIKNIQLRFDREILSNLSFSIKSGEIVGIVGASGGGKSSLLKIIAGLLDPSSGEVRLNGEKVKGPSQKLVPGHEAIQLVNQDFGLDIYHTVLENVQQKILYLPKDVRDQFTTELLDLVDLSELINQQAITLSGGEQQRLAIARALAVEPEVLLLDEPFAHLDAHLKQKIGNYIQSLAAIRKMTCILVSHEGQDVLEWSKSILFIEKGEVKRVDSPYNFYNFPTSLYEARFFGQINLLKINGAQTLFRPNQFIKKSKDGIAVIVKNIRFGGVNWIHEVVTEKKEKLVLYAAKQLPQKFNIDVKKQRK